MTKKIKFAVESPPRTGSIIIQGDEPHISEDSENIVFAVKPKPKAADAVVRLGETPPGPGPRKCWCCGLEWILEEGQPDVCPRCGHPNVITEAPPLDNVKYIWKTRDALARSEEVLEKSRRILAESEPVQRPLTVGDLSVASKRKRELEARVDARQSQERGLTVGDLYEGPEIPKPSSTESQRLAADMMEAHQKKIREIQRVKEYMAKQA